MPNYYTRFSVVIPMSQERAFKALELAKKASDWWDAEEHGITRDELSMFSDEVLQSFHFDSEIDVDGLWLYSEENCNLDAVEEFVKHILEPGECVGIEWSNECTRMCTDGFGGGAMFITKGHCEWMSTGNWVSQKEAEFKLKQGQQPKEP
jgi:hypothetical protein